LLILILLLVPLVVGIWLQAVGQGVRTGSGQVKVRGMLLLDVDLARRTFDLHLPLEHGDRGVGVFHFNPKMSLLGEG
jgi:hypothetical protein